MEYYLLCVLLAFSMSFIFKRLKKNKRKNLEVIDYAEIIKSDESFALYLRSFEDDGKSKETPISLFTLNLRTVNSFEEEIAFNFRNSNLIAIGKPNEELPELGAKRLYVADDLWKERVSYLAQRSTVILIKPSFTDGLSWELELIEKKGYWDKLIFYHVFKDMDESIAQKFYYDTFKEMVKTKFNLKLEDYCPKAKYSYFLNGLTHKQVKSLKEIPYLNKNAL